MNEDTELFSDYARQVSVLCRKYCTPDSEIFDDLLGEGMAALLSAKDSFDPHRGVKFSTYAHSVISNRLADVVKKTPPFAVEIPQDIPSLTPSPENLYIEKESEESLFSGLELFLSPLEFSVLMLRIDGLSYADIAREQGVTESSVKNALSRVRNKMRNKLRDTGIK
ncbi:MAG: sigma-70 family RNA polymerase sigma factor [Ruminococcus sp.]|jgi:RNA polymerase sigma factor (sigma-70 family)|nr:sigma-70 family RNA polymerase sigma factor [Ruminococcus sp.]